MEEEKLSCSLKENLDFLKSSFCASDDFYTKMLQINGIPCAVAMFTGLSSQEKLCTMLMEMLERCRIKIDKGEDFVNYLLNRSRIPVESTPISEKKQLIQMLANGMAVLLVDGSDKAVACSTQEIPQRSAGSPMGEGNLRGSQEGFTESLRNNIAMIRHQFRTAELNAEIFTSKTPAKTEYAVLYDNCADKMIVEKVKQVLSSAKLPLLLDTSYYSSFFKTNRLNLFPTAYFTERPATVCARLCEGKVAVLVAGSPNAMVMPVYFAEYFECLDDYASGAVFAGMIRILKYLAFLLAVFGPGLYVMAIAFTPEIIPAKLLAKLAEAELSTPLPPVLEMLGVTLLLEIVREAGLRAPKPISQTVSLVSALIIGDTAVDAGLVSVPILTMAAAATVATLVVPALYEQTILFRFIVTVLAGAFGLQGMACGAIGILAMTCEAGCFDENFLYPLIPLEQASRRDGFVRTIWTKLAQRGGGKDEAKK